MSAASGFGYPHMITLALCVPWSGRPLPPELPMSFKSCIPPMNTNQVYMEARGKPIADARNYFAEKAIEMNAKYMFFWDEDVLLPPHAIRELMFVADNYDSVAVVAGIYCLKVEHPQPMVFKGGGKGVYWDWKVGEVFECSATGLGCSLIRVEALKDMKKPWFRTIDNLDPFLDNIPIGEQWTEDLYFAERVKETKKWKWVAHGGLVMPHINIQTGQRFELPPDSKPARHLALEIGRKKILDIGSGPNPLQTNEGRVISVDLREDANPDYRCDVRRLPFATGEMDIAYSAHVLEHIPRDQIDATLEEWTRVIKPDGEMRLIVPNLEWAAKRILAGEYGNVENGNVCAMDVFYGQQTYDLDFHKTGFTPKTVEAALRKAGFKHFIIETPVFHIFVRAWRKKPKDFDKLSSANLHQFMIPQNGKKKNGRQRKAA